MSSIHPLSNVGLSISHFKCFGEEGGGFAVFQPINIIIGRNNTGKSALIDAVELCITEGKSFDQRKHARPNSVFNVQVWQKLDEASLRPVFRDHVSSGGVPGRTHWEFGSKFIGQSLHRSFGPGWSSSIQSGPDFSPINQSARQNYYNQLAKTATWPFKNLRLLKVSAERDVQPESRETTRKVSPNGAGTTNLVRAFVNSDDLPREEVEEGLLKDLNAIYQGDCEFTQIICQEDADGVWELFLKEKKKGYIRLSQSGSSLKSVFIILCMLRLVPLIETIDWKKVIFATEEPENNLHPSLLRRLLNFLSDQREQKGFILVITTHSPICIDWSARRSDSQIIHVQHDGEAAKSHTAIEYRETREIMEDLDVRASDILQANGVIWVEGPSDRIYIRRWLELASDAQLKEGVHYTIMFYGGKLLAHLDALPPDRSRSSALISLLSINRNAAVVMDSDRHPGTLGGRKPRTRLNATKLRMKGELEAIGGYVWVTEGREVENYTPIDVFARVVGKPAPVVNPYTQVVRLSLLQDFKEDKVALAHAVAPETQKADLVEHLDIWHQLECLCSHIKRWNGLHNPE